MVFANLFTSEPGKAFQHNADIGGYSVILGVQDVEAVSDFVGDMLKFEGVGRIEDAFANSRQFV